MYLEQHLYSKFGELKETIYVQKSKNDLGSSWTLSGGTNKVYGLTNVQMSVSTILLAVEWTTSTVQLPMLRPMKLEPNDDEVMVLSD